MKRSHLIILALALAGGLTIEGLKKLASVSFRPAGTEVVQDIKNTEIKPFRVSESNINRDQFRQEARRRLIGKGIKLNSIPTQNPEAMPPNTVAQVGTVAKTDDKNKDNSNKDPKKKKKKKNPRKIADAKKDQKKTEDPNKDEEEDDGSDKGKSDAENFMNETQIVSVPAVQPDNKDLPITFEDWAKLILGSPQPKNVARLVEYYKSHMVTSNIFYGILSAMMNEPNPEQHRLAVAAAGEVHNGLSFNFLIDVIKSDKVGSLIAAEAQQLIQDYSRLSQMSIVRNVFIGQSNDPVVVQILVDLLDKSTTQYLEGRTPSDSTTKPLTKEQLARLSKVYAPFVTPLQKAIEHYSSQTAIKNTAEKVLTRIKNLLVVQTPDKG